MTTRTRVESILSDADFGSSVLAGLNGSDDVRHARRVWSDLRATVGYQRASARLLTSGASQHKFGKNSLPSFGLMLTPERGLMSPALQDVRRAFGLTGAFNVCPMASKGCAAACLSRSGQSGMPTPQRAQSVRTAFLLSHPSEAGLLIGSELRLALRKSDQVNLRLNTTSDIRWELVSPEMVSGLSQAGVLLYDYTAWSPTDRTESSSYSLTYSAKETAHTTDEYLIGILSAGRNVAVPFDTKKGQSLPESWHGFPVIDGDKSDERRNDPLGVVVGLRAKGYEWKHDNSAGFIRSSLPLAAV